MLFITGVGNYMNVPTMEATTILGTLVGFVVAIMLVFFLYINRKWCFGINRKFKCCEESNLSSSSNYLCKIAQNRQCDTNSDTDEETIRRLQFQQQATNYLENISNYNNNQLLKYGSSGSSIDPYHYQYHNYHNYYHQNQQQHYSNQNNYSNLQQITVTKDSLNKDPLGVAERGKIGLPITSSDCSSISSVDGSVESTTAVLTGIKKDRRMIISDTKSLNCNSITTLKETRIDNRISRSNSVNFEDYHKLSTSPLHGIDDDIITTDFNKNEPNCILELSQEPLFDTSDLKSLKSEYDDLTRTATPPPRYGSVEISLLYDAPMRKMTVHVIQARDLPSRDRGQSTHTQIRLLMLPQKKQKHKTKIRSGENPQFIENFLLHRVNPEEVNSMGLRIRVYGCERMRRERLIGEAIVSFASIDLELETNLWLSLEPRSNTVLSGSNSDLLSLARSDSTASTASMQHGGVPELLLGLAYNGTTGRLTVEIVKGSHFRNLTLNRAPDTYVKLCLVSSLGQEISKAKTSTKKGQPNPLFKESFVFQVALFQLHDVTLMISIYAKRNMKRNEMVGWFSLGLNSSGPEEMAHWIDMRELTRGELLARWHVLVDS